MWTRPPAADVHGHGHIVHAYTKLSRTPKAKKWEREKKREPSPPITTKNQKGWERGGGRTIRRGAQQIGNTAIENPASKLPDTGIKIVGAEGMQVKLRGP